MENNRLNLNQIEINNLLPDWSISSISNDDLVPIVDDFKGNPLLILFFNLGCPGCLGRAIPYANRLVLEKGDDINLLGIHTNFESIEFSEAQFVKAKEEFFIRFPFYKDKNFDTTFLNYGAGGTPHWILVNAEGEVVYSIFGSDPNNALLRLDLKIEELKNPIEIVD